MTIATPPTTPVRTDPTNFSARMDAYLAWISTELVPGLNTYSGMTNSGQFTDGTAAAPGITFTSDTDTGFSRPGANTIGICVNGTLIGQFFGTATFRLGNPNDYPAGVSVGAIQLERADASAGQSIRRNTADTLAPFLQFLKSRATAVSGVTIVQAGDYLGQLAFYGADGSTNILGAQIRAIVEGTPALGDVRAGFIFGVGTGAAGATTTTLKLATDQTVVATGTGGLGYGAGAGGTVTQATSRTTGVTINKPTGAITMFSAAGSATAATFTVTNSKVDATDTVVISQKSGTNLYVTAVTAVAAGSFNVTFYTTGGTATDAPVFSFAVIKGATA